MKTLATTLIAAATLLPLTTQAQPVEIKIIQTSDVHGNAFPHDFITQAPGKGSLSRVATYVNHLREKHPDRVILLDNGDILQGQPPAYYFNFIDTTSTHLFAATLNFIGYDAAVPGNHDFEPGHSVYDRWAAGCKFPILAANVIDTHTGLPYFRPYTIIERSGVRVAVLGLTTPSVPQWVPADRWSGLRFEPMLATARKWLAIINEQEKPDAVVGLFHSGKEGGSIEGDIVENACMQIARELPGFDVIFMGHDHTLANERVKSADGSEVILINPAARASYASEVTLHIEKADGKLISKKVEAGLANIDGLAPDDHFMETFYPALESVHAFVSRPIGQFTETISARDAFFGPSAFIDFIHTMQLSIGQGAEISFAAPLSTTAEIKQGIITVADMFKLYPYENSLYVMQLYGHEIKNYLEMSYALWTNTMQSPTDHIIKLKAPTDTTGYRTRFANPTYNFDSAAGILYTVDVTKPEGSKITITGMADGRPFHPDTAYRVAVNSYRGNGGGELLTQGAGIPHAELQSRVLYTTPHDLRYYMMNHIMQQQTLTPRPLNHWRFTPEHLTAPAITLDRRELFGKNK